MITTSGGDRSGEAPKRPSTRATYHERILGALVCLQSRLDSPPSIEELAAVAHCSVYHFHHIFRGIVGESIGQHIKRLRLERAAMRLLHGDQPITGVAFDTGYETHEAFTRAFTAHFGWSPSEYRKRHESKMQVGNKTGTAIVRETDEPLPDVQLQVLPPRRVAFVRHIGPYAQVDRAWKVLMAWAGPQQMLGPGLTMLGIPRDVPEITPTDKLRYDACVVVPDHIDGGGEVGIQHLAGGEHAILRHRGPYERLGESYALLFGRWGPQSGREPADAPSFEVYVNSPFNAKPEELLTDLCVLLEP